MPKSLDQLANEVISALGTQPFSTDDFISEFRTRFPVEWSELEEKYGKGGAGNGSHYTVNVRIGTLLGVKADRGEIDRLDYANSVPEGWGSPVIRYWSAIDNPESSAALPLSFPDEITESAVYEGSKKQITVNVYERDPRARAICLKALGCIACAACGFDFEKAYGDIGKGYIHVHHRVPLSSIGKEYNLNPTQDLVPVCPNCHAMIHRRTPPYSVDEIKSMLSHGNVP